MNNKIRDLLGLEDPVGLFKKKAGLFKKKSVKTRQVACVKTYLVWKTQQVACVKTYRVWKTQQVVLLFACTLFMSCQQNYTPKPNAYYRIDFPEKEYRTYDSICPFTFVYPVYGMVIPDVRPTSDPCWLNIRFPKYNGTIHLTYKEIDSDFDSLIENDWKLLHKIAQRSDGIDYDIIDNPEVKVYGMIYHHSGNAASQVQFFVTDSVKNYLRGALYITAKPNYDSLAPVIAFFREDIIVLIESFRWKEKEKVKPKKSWD